MNLRALIFAPLAATAAAPAAASLGWPGQSFGADVKGAVRTSKHDSKTIFTTPPLLIVDRCLHRRMP